ncbi:MAG TPA: hypothetical protein VGG28_04395 [Kofleriaceae bacterium]|jgi:hypothetical protein
MNDIARATAKRELGKRERRELMIESLGEARRMGAAIWTAIAICVAIPGALFAMFGPGNGYTEIAVAAPFAMLALVIAIALPSMLQRRFAARELAALRALGGFDVERYCELLAEPRDAGRLVVNVELAATPDRDRIERALVGWHLEWDGATLLAETDELPGKLVFDSQFKSTNVPQEAFTNAAFHAKLRVLVAAIGTPTKLAVAIA